MFKLNFNNNWNSILKNEFKKEYFKNIEINFNKSLNLKIYPKKEDIFNVFKLCDFNNIKIVIIGQDPYYNICKKSNISYANGLAFSINKKCKKLPPSLKNIYKILKNDLNIENINGNLTSWAEQGIFLINTQLTVIENKPNSHKFWKPFTDNIIKYISENKNNVIFVLWGRNALKKLKLINNKKHYIMISSHPSPLSYKRKLGKYPSFEKSNIFKNINLKLKEINLKKINWKINEIN